jgi:DNA-binding transcriptional LysR family regulator
MWTFARKNSKSPLTIAIEPRLSVTTAEAAIDAAISGLGVTQVLSYQVADRVEAGQLQIVLREFQPGSVPVNLVHLGQMRQARKVRVFLDYLVPRLRQRLRDPA